MMRRTIMVSTLTLIAPLIAFACNKANFGGDDGERRSDGDVLPAGGLQNPAAPPLDASQDSGIPDGPKPGTGQVLDTSIDIDCDQAEGVIVDINPPGIEPLPPEAQLHLGDTGIGPDGKPLGPDGGKPDGGKPTDPPLPGKPPVEIPGGSQVTAKVKGAFCPTARNQLTVLFVVDYSGSMGRHIHDLGTPEVPGNDPQTAGSCGRLQAAQAIVQKILAEKAAGDSVQIGMVPFAGGVLSQKVVGLTDIAAFSPLVNKDVFCQYVVQDPSFGYDPINPGGINGGGLLGIIGGVDSSTNYHAAFTAAQSVLGGVYGRKVVYFISDGEPTSGGADPVQAGIAAGAALRATVDNLTLNALLLGNVGPAAEQVLVGVAGSPDRVRRAANADELAREILAFPEASIDESTGRATLTVAPYPTKPLGLFFLTKHPSRPAVWIYETQPFFLLGVPGTTTLNVVEVTALGTDGSTYRSLVKIRYRQ